MLIAEAEIPQMFSACAEDLGYISNGLHHYQYFCISCSQAFTSAWGRKSGMNVWYEKGDYFYCTHCGNKHEKYVTVTSAMIPNKVRLKVREFKDVVTFEVNCSTVQFDGLLKISTEKQYKEMLHFNINKQTVKFSRYKNNRKIGTQEIGNPFKLDFLNESILRFFRINNYGNLYHKPNLNKVLKTLRETLHQKLEKKLGYKIASMHVSAGQYHGMFLIPLFNLAYRVVFPNAPNLPKTYRENEKDIEHFLNRRENFNSDAMDDAIAIARKNNDHVTALITAYSLPNTPLVKKVLGINPFEIGLLAKAFSICRNYDYAIRFFNRIKIILLKQNITVTNDDLFRFIHNMRLVYDDLKLIHMIENHVENYLRDCVRLYHLLNNENRELLKTQRVRMRDLHDWMSLKHTSQNHVNVKFDLSDYAVKRFSLQTKQYRFFLPKESLELLQAGIALHNCVLSYTQSMKDGKILIVLVAKKGEIIACLEVKHGRLVQAEIDRNKPVSKNPELNAQVIKWAEKAKLQVVTSDISLQETVSKAN